MLNHTELKKGTLFIYNDQPYIVLDFALNFQGRGGSTAQIKMKSLITGNVLSKVFHPGDNFEEADVDKIQLKFVYAGKGQYVFSESDNPNKRLTLAEEQVEGGRFLKPGQTITGLSFDDKIISANAPIKVQLRVKEAAVYLRAGRAEAGTKEVILETGASIQAPSFIKEGDIIEINTQTGEYSRRVE
ncbi:MAG: hypothetical protein PHU56_01075 [Candidatus Pacebacteria bacterium]|nr:hypothetical protein [Candidatus Paceibacterota bacterium]